MKFYDHLAKTYDYFIDWEARIKNEDPFFQQIFRESLGNSVLDLGCGTGGYDIYLAEMGFNVVGIDSSRQMINAAQARAEEEDQCAIRFGDLQWHYHFSCSRRTSIATPLQREHQKHETHGQCRISCVELSTDLGK